MQEAFLLHSEVITLGLGSCLLLGQLCLLSNSDVAGDEGWWCTGDGHRSAAGLGVWVGGCACVTLGVGGKWEI